jgi:hypothetical protein
MRQRQLPLRHPLPLLLWWRLRLIYRCSLSLHQLWERL